MKDIINIWLEDKIQKTIWLLYIFLTISLLLPSVKEILLHILQFDNEPLLLTLAASILLHIATISSYIRYAIQKTSQKKQAKDKKDISALAFQFLSQFGVEGNVAIPTQAFAKSFDIPFQKAQHAIDELLAFGLLGAQLQTVDEMCYYITSRGREFLAKNGEL